MSENKKDIEKSKRGRELWVSLFLALSLLLLVWLEIRLFSFGQQLPLNQSIFFFGLVNFNLILLLGLSFFILRNLFKAFVERRRGVLGNSLKSRLIAAFLGFSVIPTALMFVIALFYINSSFDRWFSDKMQDVLKSALEVSTEYYSSAKKKNFNAAFILAGRLDEVTIEEWKPMIEQFRSEQSLDVVEVYQDLESDRLISMTDDQTFPVIPTVKIDRLRKSLSKKVELAEMDTLDQGKLIRVMVPLKKYVGAVAISSFIPGSMISKMENVAVAYEEMKGLNYPLKSIYVIVLILMTSMILVCSVWFGLYIAKHLSMALESLGDATQKVAEGQFQKVNLVAAEYEVQQLANNFNFMIDALKKSRKETVEANDSLKLTLKELDQRRRYMQVVLSNVNTGVISLDDQDRITMINDKAAKLLKLDAGKYLNQSAETVLGEKYYRLFRQMVLRMKSHKLASVQKEIVFDLKTASVPSVLKISPLYNEKGEDIGKVVAFDDLTDLIQGQRAAAWKEVARRIAHEVKNPLTPIKLSAQRLRKKFSSEIDDPAFASCIDMIVDQTDSLKHLINEFSQFARLPETRPRLSNLNDLMEKVLLFYEQAHRKVKFVGRLDNQIEPFFLDPEQLKRAIFNLVQNSVRAVEKGENPEIHLQTELDKKLSIVTISVIDNGENLNEDDLRRMFEPYYSKSPGGTGLGLTIVKKIVEDHNGFVRMTRNEPRGLVAQVELPYIKV